ncbi:hypothetical protein PZH33_22415, partial [Blautia schinkii]|nr:hypothetical protein [Blautia schinkii]
LGFVPQMAILFLFLSILEDCGYMVRIAFVMDCVFRHFGLSMEKYEEANALLKKIPDTVIDATIMKTSVLAHQEGTDTAALFLEGKLLQAVVNIQSYLY